MKVLDQAIWDYIVALYGVSAAIVCHRKCLARAVVDKSFFQGRGPRQNQSESTSHRVTQKKVRSTVWATKVTFWSRLSQHRKHHEKGIGGGLMFWTEWLNGGWGGRWMDGWIDRWIDRSMDGSMNGWMDGWMDGWRDRFRPTESCLCVEYAYVQCYTCSRSLCK